MQTNQNPTLWIAHIQTRSNKEDCGSKMACQIGTRTLLGCRLIQVSKHLLPSGSRFLAEMQAQLDKISAKLDFIAADVKEMSDNVRPNFKP